MAIDALVKPLLSLPLFSGLKPFYITEIVHRADRIVYRPGDSIIEEDQAGDAAIVIVSGQAVRVTHGDEGLSSEPIPEGSMVGELAMLVETIHTASILARSTVRALRITRREMHAMMLEHPALADHLTAQITARLKRLALELKSVDDTLSSSALFGSHTLRAPDIFLRPALIH